MERDLISLHARICRLEAILGMKQSNNEEKQNQPLHIRLQNLNQQLSLIPDEMVAAMQTVRLLSRVRPSSDYSDVKQKFEHIKPQLTTLSTLVSSTTLKAPELPTVSQNSQLTDLHLRLGSTKSSLREMENDVDKVLAVHNHSVERINARLVHLSSVVVNDDS